MVPRGRICGSLGEDQTVGAAMDDQGEGGFARLWDDRSGADGASPRQVAGSEVHVAVVHFLEGREVANEQIA